MAVGCPKPKELREFEHGDHNSKQRIELLKPGSRPHDFLLQSDRVRLNDIVRNHLVGWGFSQSRAVDRGTPCRTAHVMPCVERTSSLRRWSYVFCVRALVSMAPSSFRDQADQSIGWN